MPINAIYILHLWAGVVSLFCNSIQNKMNYLELTQSIKESYSGCGFVTSKPGSHCSFLLGKVKFMPSSKAQAIKHVRAFNHGYDNLLMVGEWNAVESFLNKHGFAGEYAFTKSKTMCRLVNVQDLISALKIEFSL